MNKKLWLRFGISVLAVFGVLEGVAIFDNDENTYTLTSAIINNVPQWIFWTILTPVMIWIVWHFKKYYKKVKR